MNSERERLPPEGLRDDFVAPAGPPAPVGSPSWERSPKRVLWEIIRVLNVPDDLPLLRESLPAAQQSITQIRHSHHQLARLLSEGMPIYEASLITGYSPNTISRLQNDPMFNELVSYYYSNEDKKHVDVMDRLRALGMSTLEELQTRLDENPESFSLRELMEQVELTIVKPMMAASRAGSFNSPANITGGVQVSVKFVSTDPPNTATIDVTPAIEGNAGETGPED